MSDTLKSFCDELRLTFPELKVYIDRAATTSNEQFWKSWQNSLSILLDRSAERLFSEKKGFIIGAVRLTPAVWAELSEETQNAIWAYLRTMALESAMDETLTAETTQTLHDILVASRPDADLLESHMKPMMEKLKGLLGSFGLEGGIGGIDISGLSDFPMPEIPERLRKGRIAKLAEDMAKQFDPAEFGIDPALMKSDDIGDVLKRLAELFQKDPTLLIGGAKRVAERIKTQIMGGSLNREELMAEAQEFVALFKEHPLFKEAIAKFESLTGAGGLGALFGSGSGSDGGGGGPSDRLRSVQERLRKKMEARNNSKGGRK